MRSPNPNALYPPELSTPIPSFSPSPSPSPTLTPESKYSAYLDEGTATPRAATSPPSPLLYTPGMPLRLSIENLRRASNRNVSLGISFPFASQIHQSSSLSSVSVSSAGSQSPSESHLIRKKSGQVVRSSLKSSSSYCSTHSGFTLGVSPALPSSKSEPSTPMYNVTPTISKAVHFDTNLERVKLFLAGQKPLAVSREGSPIDTDEGEWDTCTSGTESEAIATRATFPASERLNDDDKPPLTKLIMQTDIPPRSSPFPPSFIDVALESLLLSPDEKSIIGNVLVRNIAYEKKVTARFTLDGWCTTSEVTAKWNQTVGVMKDGRGEFDRFGFVIWLGDVKSSEQRKLELALRYRVEGRSLEMWDNNGGGNYVATFSRVGVVGLIQPEGKERGRKAPLRKKVPPIPFSDYELSDLLEKAAAAKNFRKSRSPSPADWTPTKPAKGPLRSSSSPPASTASPLVSGGGGGLHTRTRSFPFPSPSPTSSSSRSKCGWMELSPPSPPVPVWPRQKMRAFGGSPTMAITTQAAVTTTLGSPRDFGDDAFHPGAQFKFPSIPDGEEGAKDNNNNKLGGGGRTRRHQRGGYFDLFFPEEAIPKVSRKYNDLGLPTDTSPTPISSSSRFASFPPLNIISPQRRSRRELRQRHIQQVQVESDLVPVEKDESPSCVVGHVFSALDSEKVSADSRDRDVESSSSGSTEASMENDLGSSSSRSSTPPSLEGEEEPPQDSVPLGSEGKEGGDEPESYGELLSR